MNLTVGRSLPKIWKRITFGQVTLAAGLAVAVTAAVALGTRDNENARDTAVTRAPVEPPVLSSSAIDGARVATEPTGLVYYIVGSEDQAARVQQGLYEAEAELWASGGTLDNTRHHILVAETTEQQAHVDTLLAIASRELMQAGVAFQVLDLRKD